MTGLFAIVLAAGAGTRFGGAKLSAPWNGGALIDGALTAALAAPADAVVVVTGSDPAVAAVVARRDDPRLRIVECPDWAAGLSASLRAGISALPPKASAALVYLGDMPDVPTGIAGPLVHALTDGALAAAPVHGGLRGHPVAFAAVLFPRLMRLEGDRGAGALLAELGDAVTAVETADAGVLFDVDLRA